MQRRITHGSVGDFEVICRRGELGIITRRTFSQGFAAIASSALAQPADAQSAHLPSTICWAGTSI
jgi:hypothetical protein